MCNLYSLTKGQAAIRDWFRARRDRMATCRSCPVFSRSRWLVRTGADGERELVMARWGMPAPPQHGGHLATNIRNVSSPHRRDGSARETAA
jgi:putative SOS response-associated peptidase YedK